MAEYDVTVNMFVWFKKLNRKEKMNILQKCIHSGAFLHFYLYISKKNCNFAAESCKA